MFKIMIIILLILCGFNLSVNAENTNGKNFMLPKTFKINDEFLPPLDASSIPEKNKTVSTETPKVNKTTQTVKTNPVKSSSQIINKSPAVYKQPALTITTPAKNNGAKSSTVQTNTIKPNILNKVNNASSLTNLIKNYDCDYSGTLKSTIIALSTMGIATSSYNTEKGQILATLPSGKELFILVVPFNNNSTYVRITPADGNYNLPMATINTIFSNIQDNLTLN